MPPEEGDFDSYNEGIDDGDESALDPSQLDASEDGGEDEGLPSLPPEQGEEGEEEPESPQAQQLRGLQHAITEERNRRRVSERRLEQLLQIVNRQQQAQVPKPEKPAIPDAEEDLPGHLSGHLQAVAERVQALEQRLTGEREQERVVGEARDLQRNVVQYVETDFEQVAAQHPDVLDAYEHLIDGLISQSVQAVQFNRPDLRNDPDIVEQIARAHVHDHLTRIQIHAYQNGESFAEHVYRLVAGGNGASPSGKSKPANAIANTRRKMKGQRSVGAGRVAPDASPITTAKGATQLTDEEFDSYVEEVAKSLGIPEKEAFRRVAASFQEEA